MPPPPLPLTWHLLQADGNSVSEEAGRGPRSQPGGGGTDTQLCVCVPVPVLRGCAALSPGTAGMSWAGLSPSSWGWLPSRGRVQPSTPPHTFLPHLCCLNAFRLLLKPSVAAQSEDSWGGQAGAPQTPALTPSLPQFPHLGSEKRLLPSTGAGKLQPRAGKTQSRAGKMWSSPEPPPASESRGDAQIPFRESGVVGAG